MAAEVSLITNVVRYDTYANRESGKEIDKLAIVGTWLLSLPKYQLCVLTSIISQPHFPWRRWNLNWFVKIRCSLLLSYTSLWGCILFHFRQELHGRTHTVALPFTPSMLTASKRQGEYTVDLPCIISPLIWSDILRRSVWLAEHWFGQLFPMLWRHRS